MVHNGECNDDLVVMLLMWGWMVRLILMRMRRRLRNVSGTFNCGFEAIRNKVYFDMMKLLLPFCVFEFEVIIIVLSVLRQWFAMVSIIILVMLVELIGNGFGV